MRQRFGKGLTSSGPLGETWETGVGARVINGIHAGRSLGEVTKQWGPALIGTRPRVPPDAPFPLLVKFIDAAADLSVQVHPTDAGARVAGHACGKTEAWFILDATAGAKLFHGWLEPAPPSVVAAAVQDGTIERLIRPIAARTGTALFTPAGTIHAIGGGVLLYEVQQYSDLTYRLHDWNRTAASGSSRELHVEQGLAALDYDDGSPAPVAGLDIDAQRSVLAACKYFSLERWSLAAAQHVNLDGTTCHVATVISGTATFTIAGAPAVTLHAGQTTILPAGAGGYTVEPTGHAVALVTYVPDLVDDIVTPLRARGHADGAIAALGGGPIRRNDFLPLLGRS